MEHPHDRVEHLRAYLLVDLAVISVLEARSSAENVVRELVDDWLHVVAAFECFVLRVLAFVGIDLEGRRCLRGLFEGHVRKNNTDIFLRDVLLLVEVVPTELWLCYLHFEGQLHFFLEGWQEHVLESSHEWVLEDEVVFGSFERAEEAVADDSWQFREFEERHVVDVGLVYVCLLWRVAANGHVVEKVAEVGVSDLGLEPLVNDGIKFVDQNSFVLRETHGRSIN